MNSNTVLSRIMTLLSINREEELFAFARLADGTILESPTFDVGETVEVVAEDGTKTPAPDGEHELELTGEEGELVRFKIFTENGVITERENVELEAETIEVEPLPQTTDEDEANKVEMEAEEVELEAGEAVDEEKQDLPSVDVVELEKRISAMEATLEEIKEKIAEEVSDVIEDLVEGETEMEDEEEDDKLDGAPVEMSKINFKPTKTVKSSQNLFLNKLYK